MSKVKIELNPKCEHVWYFDKEGEYGEELNIVCEKCGYYLDLEKLSSEISRLKKSMGMQLGVPIEMFGGCMSKWVRLDDLRQGAIFETKDGILAMKTEYHTFNDCAQCDCYLLASGEAAHFEHGDDELVRRIKVKRQNNHKHEWYIDYNHDHSEDSY